MTWQALDLAADIYSKPSEPPIRCGLIYAGKRHLISGPPEAAKTLLALIFAIEEIRAGGTVAIIDFESGPAETRRLLEDLGATLEEIGAIHYFEPDAATDRRRHLHDRRGGRHARDHRRTGRRLRRIRPRRREAPRGRTVRPHLDPPALAARHRDDRDRPRRQEPREPRQVLDRLRTQTRHRRRSPRAKSPQATPPRLAPD